MGVHVFDLSRESLMGGIFFSGVPSGCSIYPIYGNIFVHHTKSFSYTLVALIFHSTDFVYISFDTNDIINHNLKRFKLYV